MTKILSNPSHGDTLVNDADEATPVLQLYLDEITERLNTLLGDRIPLESYTVAGVPPVSEGIGVIFVSDESAGATMAFSDGTNWRRTSDRAIIS